MASQIEITDELRLSMPTAFRVAVRVFDTWRFSQEEAAKVLGLEPEHFDAPDQESAMAEAISPELVERTSYVLGIEKYLEILFNDEERAIADWIESPSDAEPLEGQTPKQKLLTGSTEDLRRIRDYLAFMASPPFT